MSVLSLWIVQMEILVAGAGDEKSFMISKVFIDTNILIYCMDKSEPERMAKCRTLLKSLKSIQGVISTQVMQEFFVAATRKLKADPLIVKDILRSFRGNLKW